MARKRSIQESREETICLLKNLEDHARALVEEVQENRAMTAMALEVVRDYTRVLEAIEQIADHGTHVSDLRVIGQLIRTARKNGDEAMARRQAENEAAKHHKGGTA